VRYRDCHFEAGGRRQEAGRSAPHYSEKGCKIKRGMLVTDGHATTNQGQLLEDLYPLIP